MGHEVRRLVVIGHHHVDALSEEPVDLVLGGDAVVYGHDEVWLPVCQHAIEGSLREAVPLAKAVRDVGARTPAKLAQAKREDTGGAHAVDVKVAKDGDVLPRPHGPLHAIRCLGHAGNHERVCPVALERGREERFCLRGAGEATGHKNPRHEARHAQGISKGRLDARIRVEDVPASTVEKTRHASLPWARSSRQLCP